MDQHWWRNEAGHGEGREQLKVSPGCPELGRDEEKKETFVVAYMKVSTLCKMVFLAGTGGWVFRPLCLESWRHPISIWGAVLNSPLTEQLS